MMRKVLFRGKRLSDGAWIYGGVVAIEPQKEMSGDRTKGNPTQFAIVTKGDVANLNAQRKYTMCQVDPATVGQYTGFDDKYGNQIFEGDIVRMDRLSPTPMIIAFVDGAFCFVDGNGRFLNDIYYLRLEMLSGENCAMRLGNIFEERKEDRKEL